MFERYERFVLDGFFGRTSQERSRAKVGRLSDNCCPKWMASGTVWRGAYLTRSSSEWPKDGAVSFLSDVLEPAPPSRFSLSPKACEGILRRAEKRGRGLPPKLDETLRAQASSSIREPERGGVGYELELSPTCTADWHNPAVLTEESETGCLNGWDVQSKRIYDPAAVGPTLPSGTSEGMNIQPPVLTKYICETTHTGSNGLGVGESDIMPTLDTSASAAVAYDAPISMSSLNTNATIETDMTGTLMSRPCDYPSVCL